VAGFGHESKIIAFDAIPIRRSHDDAPGVHKAFSGHLAVGISVSEVESLAEKYERIIDDLFRDIGLPRTRLSYKASEIARLVGGRISLNHRFFFQFGRRLLALDGLKVNVVAGVFDEAALRTEARAAAGLVPIPPGSENKVVPIYGGGPGRTYVTLFDFLNKLADSFPIAAAWKLTQRTGLGGHTFLLDGYQGEAPRAWHELTRRNIVQLVPRGDHCDPYLSCADLLLRSVNIQLTIDALPLEPRSLWQVLGRLGGADQRPQIFVNMIGNEDIPMIAPYDHSRVPQDQFLRHPIFFVIKEESGSLRDIEDSPLLGQVYDRAYSERGSVALYEPGLSAGLLHQGDWLTIYGDRGEGVRRDLRQLRYPFNVWDLRRPAEHDPSNSTSQ
jgi:hypothetical protein